MVSSKRNTQEYDPTDYEQVVVVGVTNPSSKSQILTKLRIRRVAAGDRFAPFGMLKGTKLVSDYLTDRHRSVLEKQAAAVVCDERGIVWLVGETVDRRVAVHRSTQTILDIRLLPPDREA